MNGLISAHPFAELLREISHSKLSGALRMEQERIKVVVYFAEGNPVFAASNVKALRLSEYLIKRGSVSANQIAAVGNSSSDAALAKALAKQGFIQEAEIESAFTALVRDVMRVAMLWSEGSWVYDNLTQPAESIQVKISTRNFLLEGARKMALQFVATRFTTHSEMISPSKVSADSDRLLPEEGFVMSRVDSPLPLKDLIALSGLREADAIRIVYGLVLADFLRREHWPNVLATLKGSTQKKPTVSAPRPAMEKPQKTEAEEVAEFLRRIEVATNHYEVLDVSQAASLDDIKRAYYMHARRYHPDRFHSQEVHRRVEDAFARITQAHETLVDTGQRNTYDARLAAQERAKQLAESAPRAKSSSDDTAKSGSAMSSEKQRAEASFKDGYAALKLGQVNAAVPLLAAAAQGEPDEARYRAYYGQALARQGTNQRLAELELQAAVRLDASNIQYRLMLANLYFELKFFKRSLAEVERALAVDPNNVLAQELLKKLTNKEEG